MDQQKLRTLVFEKTGVRIDVDDPIFALVALNEAVLAEAVERHVALIDDATADLADQADALLAVSRGQGQGQGYSPAPALAEVGVKTAPPVQRRSEMANAALTAALTAALVLAGQALFFRPGTPPPSTVIAKELTPEQARAIRDGEKLASIVRKLDQKTRNAIQAEMQKQ